MKFIHVHLPWPYLTSGDTPSLLPALLPSSVVGAVQHLVLTSVPVDPSPSALLLFLALLLITDRVVELANSLNTLKQE